MLQQKVLWQLSPEIAEKRQWMKGEKRLSTELDKEVSDEMSAEKATAILLTSRHAYIDE